MSAPDFVEPIVGYRAWRPDGGALAPWSAGRVGAGAWTPGVNEATCLHVGAHPGQAPPVPDCSCGLYALADLGDRRLRPAHEAVGAIVAWGDVEVHATGFRAQYAAVVALGIPERCGAEHRAELEAAAARYGVRAVAVDHLRDAALEYGRPVAFDAILLPRARSAIRIRRAPVPALGAQGTQGIALDEHLDVTIERGGIALRPTEPLAREMKGAAPEWVAPAGTTLAAGDVFARASGFALRTPAGGVVGEAGVEAWIAPARWDEDAQAIEWGTRGRRLYSSELADARRRGDAFAHLRTHWLHAHARIRSARDVLDALRAQRGRPRFATPQPLLDRLTTALEHDDVRRAAARAGRVAWRLHDPEVDLVLTEDGLRVGPPAGSDLVLHAPTETADDYFAGRLDLPAALRRRKIQSSAPPGAILRAASVLKPLHARYAEASSRASSFAS